MQYDEEDDLQARDDVLVVVNGRTLQVRMYSSTTAAAVTDTNVYLGTGADVPVNIGVCYTDAVKNRHLPYEFLGAASTSSYPGSMPIDLVRCHVPGMISKKKKTVRGNVGFDPHVLSCEINRLPVDGRRGIIKAWINVSQTEAIAGLLNGKCPPCGLVAVDIVALATGLHVWPDRNIPRGLLQLRAYAMHPYPLHVMAGLGLLRSSDSVTHQDVVDAHFLIKPGAPASLSLLWTIFGGPKPLHVLTTPSEYEACAWVLDSVTDEHIWTLVGNQLRHKLYYELWQLATQQATDAPATLICRNLQVDADLNIIMTTVDQGVSIRLEIAGSDVTVAGVVRLLQAMPTNKFQFAFAPECRTIIHSIVTFQI